MYLIYLNNQPAKSGTKAYLTKCAIGSQLGKTQFIQSTIPANFPYWKVVEGELVSMTNEEIAHVQAVENYKKIKAKDFLGYRYRLEVPPEFVAEPTSVLAKVIRMLASKSTDQDNDPENGNVRAYFNTVNPDDASLLTNPEIVIFDSDIYNPDSDQYIAP